METESSTIQKAAELLGKLRAGIGEAMVGQPRSSRKSCSRWSPRATCSSKACRASARRCWCARWRRRCSCPHGRVQFTPDMMPSDITGHAVLDPKTMEMRVVRGPVFTHLLLADEINRAPAKTQSALLEVMQEYQVTLEGQTHRAAQAVHGARHAEPGGDRRHLSAAGSAARPLPVQDRDRLSVARRTKSAWSSAPPPTRPATSCRCPRSKPCSTSAR